MFVAKGYKVCFP